MMMNAGQDRAILDLPGAQITIASADQQLLGLNLMSHVVWGRDSHGVPGLLRFRVVLPRVESCFLAGLQSERVVGLRHLDGFVSQRPRPNENKMSDGWPESASLRFFLHTS
ncbi:MAG: hypothetical protein ACJ8NS_06775 [Chthoniobacterales bacterium]